MQEQTANSKAVVNSIKFFAGLIIVAAVVYSEILFLGIVGGLFPAGPLAIGAMIGAVTTGLSILALCLGKSHWFRPGQQLIVAWIFTIVEVAVLIANDILAYQLHTGAQLDQFTSTWKLFCVATPALSLVGWILLFYFDPHRTIMHKKMEMEDNQARAKIDLDSMAHRKAMQFHYRAIDMVGTGMEQQMERLMPYYTEMAARQKLAEIASDLTGRHVSHGELGAPKQTPLLPQGQIVEAASKDQVLDPHGVKPQIDNEKKKIERKPLIDFSLPKGVKSKETKKIEPVEEEEQRETIEEEGTDEWKPGDQLPENYLDWTDEQWKQAKNDLDAFTYQQIFDETFPDQVEEEPKKKGKGGKKAKN